MIELDENTQVAAYQLAKAFVRWRSDGRSKRAEVPVDQALRLWWSKSGVQDDQELYALVLQRVNAVVTASKPGINLGV